jgi:hypothetical protein
MKSEVTTFTDSSLMRISSTEPLHSADDVIPGRVIASLSSVPLEAVA